MHFLLRGVKRSCAFTGGLWNLSEDMLARAHSTGKMTAVNPAWTQVPGFFETEMLTRPDADFMHPDDMYAHKRRRPRHHGRNRPPHALQKPDRDFGRWHFARPGRWRPRVS